MVGDLRNQLHVSLFAMVLKNFSNSFAKQSIKFFSKRIFFLDLPCKCHPGRLSVINNPSLIELA